MDWTGRACLAATCLFAALSGPAQTPAPAPAPAPAGPPGPPTTTPAPTAIDAKAEEVLVAMGRFYREASHLSADIAIIFRFDHSGNTGEIRSTYGLRFSRPRAVALVGGERTSSGSVYCDGSRFVAYLPTTGRYTETAAPPTLVELMQETSHILEVTGSPSRGMEALLLQALFSDDPYRTMLASSTQVRYVAEESVEGATWHRIRFLEPTGHLDIWVEAGERPWVRRFMPDLSSAQKAAPSPVTFTLEVQFDTWGTAAIEPAAYAFVPPAGAVKAGDLDEARGLPPRDQRPGPPARP